MISERECYVYIVLPGATEFITAGRFRVFPAPEGEPVGNSFTGGAISIAAMPSNSIPSSCGCAGGYTKPPGET